MAPSFHTNGGERATHPRRVAGDFGRERDGKRHPYRTSAFRGGRRGQRITLDVNRMVPKVNVKKSLKVCRHHVWNLRRRRSAQVLQKQGERQMAQARRERRCAPFSGERGSHYMTSLDLRNVGNFLKLIYRDQNSGPC